jgi:hypothetical protein
MLFALITLCETEHLILEVSEGITVFDELCRILKGTMIEDPEVKNLKLKQLNIFTAFPILVNKIKPCLTHNESDHLMEILERAFQVNWGNRDEQFRMVNALHQLHRDLIKTDSIRLKSV